MKKLSLSVFATVGLALGASGVRANESLPEQPLEASSYLISASSEGISQRTWIGHGKWSHKLALWKNYCAFHPFHSFCAKIVAKPQPQPPVQQPQPPVQLPQPPSQQPQPPTQEMPDGEPWPPNDQPQMPDGEPWPPSDQPADDDNYPIPLPPRPTPDEPWPTEIMVNEVNYPICSSSKLDPDGDGWGWQENKTCIVYFMPCSSASLDPDGDGWGWENEESCSVWR